MHYYYLITVIRGGAHVGEFVIQAPQSNEPQLLKRLSDDDNGQICYHLHLSMGPPLADLADQRQTFTSSQGHKIWIIPAAP